MNFGMIKTKYGDKVRLCYMDTDSFVINIETEDFYADIASDVEKWFDISLMKRMKDHYQ